MFYSQFPFNLLLKVKADHRHLKIFTTSSVTHLLLQFIVKYWGMVRFLWSIHLLLMACGDIKQQDKAGHFSRITLNCVCCEKSMSCRKWTLVVLLFLNPSLDCLDLCKPPEKRDDWEEFEVIFSHYFVYGLRMGPNVWKSV